MPMLLYARKRGRGETRVIELDSREAIKIMKQNRKYVRTNILYT